MAYQKLLSQILGEIRPSPETVKDVESAAAQFRREVQQILDDIVDGGRVEIEGSVAKGTYLGDEYDIDVFAFYPKEIPRETLEDTTLRLGKSWAESRGARFQISYAEHPYVTVNPVWDGKEVEVDVVGAYQVDRASDLRSSVDRTRFHTEYVRNRISPELRDQILLSKKFMKGTGVYGSEVRVGGFSGLLCEVLTIAHGSLLELLKSAAGWKTGHVVDLEGLNPDAGEVFSAPLIVVDPTDGGRNAGAAVTDDKYSTFITAARSFLETPTRRFFFPRERSPFSKDVLREKLRDRGTSILTLEFEKPDVIDDIIYPQIKRMLKNLSVQLEENGFALAGPRNRGICEDSGRVCLFLEFSISQLPRIEKRQGPSVEMVDHSNSFLEKHIDSNPYIEGDRWYVDAPRKFFRAEDLVRRILRKNPQGILPSHLARAERENWRLRVDEEAIDSAGIEARRMITQHFAWLFPWQV